LTVSPYIILVVLLTVSPYIILVVLLTVSPYIILVVLLTVSPYVILVVLLTVSPYIILVVLLTVSPYIILVVLLTVSPYLPLVYYTMGMANFKKSSLINWNTLKSSICRALWVPDIRNLAVIFALHFLRLNMCILFSYDQHSVFNFTVR